MCKSKAESGVRCTHNNSYGKQIRNLQAKKQYHTKQGNLQEAQLAADKMEDLKLQREQLKAHAPNITPFTIPVSESAEKTLDALKEAGFTPYIVGGTVRDALTKQPIKDVDIEVYNADHDDVVKALKKIGKVDEVGKQFGVIKVVVDGEDFDISLPRRDNKTGSGHTGFTVEVDKDLTLQEATQRRDFTVNALMYDHSLGYIIDAHTGLEDYDNRVLKHVSDAFDEDPLRVLRGVQMAARFDMQLHEDTVERAKTLAPEFNALAKERVQIEFEKLFTKSYYPNKGFQVLKETQWDQNFPGLAEVNTPELHEDLRKAGELAQRQKLSQADRVKLFGAIIAKRIDPKHQRDFLSYITVGDKLKNETYNLANCEAPTQTDSYALKHWVHQMSKGADVESWARIQEVTHPDSSHADILDKAQKLGISTQPEPDLMNGNVLMEILDKKPGQWMRPALAEVRDAQYKGLFTDGESASRWVENNKDKLLAI